MRNGWIDSVPSGDDDNLDVTVVFDEVGWIRSISFHPFDICFPKDPARDC